jgi:ribose transport system substrate-binding protein
MHKKTGGLKMKNIKRFLLASLVVVLVITSLTACSSDGNKPSSEPENTGNDTNGEKITIGVAQCHMNTPYRVALKSEMEQTIAEKGLNWEIILTDGQNNSAKQTSDVEDLIQKGVDLIIMAPVQSEPLAPVAKRVMDAGIPLILIDRTISTEDYTAFVGGDNVMIGELAADFIGEKLSGKGNVAMIQGTLGASATNDRYKGFVDTIKEKYPDIKLISDLTGDYKRDMGMKVMEDLLQANEQIDAVYSHSDNMILGALQASDAAGRTEGMITVSADGQKEAFDKIKEGKLSASIIYPTGAKEAVGIANKVLNGEKVDKINLIPVTLVDSENVDEMYDSGF